MDQNQTGTPVTPEQAPSTQATPEQPTQQTAQTAQIPTQQAAETPKPSALPPEVQAQLDTLQKQLAEKDQSVRYFQSRADQIQNQLKAVMGVAPQANPLDQYLKPYTDAGINAEDARILAQRDYQNDQRFSQLQNSFAAQSQIPNVLNQVASKHPHLFSSPEVVQAMENSLREAALSGNAANVTPEYAFGIGAIEYMQRMGGQFAQAAPPQQPPQFRSQFGPMGNYSPATAQAPAQPQIPAHLQQAAQLEAAQIASRFNFKPSK